MAALVRILRAAALAASMAAISAYGSLPAAPPATKPIAAAVDYRPLDLGPDIASFYRDRGFRPLWVSGSSLRPEVPTLLQSLPARPELDAAVRAAAGGDPRALTRADLLLTKAYVDRVAELQAPPDDNRMVYVDAELRPAAEPARAILDRLAAAPTAARLALVKGRNPAFDGLSRGLALYRARWSHLPQVAIAASGDQRAQLRRRLGLSDDSADGLAQALREFQRVHGLAPSGQADPATVAALNRGAAHYERLIETNIERARAIPPQPTGRYVIVDTASARLWLVEDGRIRDSMKVIVGKQGMQTPVMAGLMRHVVLNPYWNMPPDLIRQRARNAARRGAAVITQERLQVLSDWSDRARLLNPRQVNWSAVASGKSHVNMRQLPGPHNMMGAIKFMFPNDLGIYLHDTPFKDHFGRDDRRISSGCVRVEDAQRLARWLFGGAAPRPSGEAEQEVDLPQPVPVFITYLTALPTRDGVIFQPDRYGRDRIRTSSVPNRAGRATL